MSKEHVSGNLKKYLNKRASIRPLEGFFDRNRAYLRAVVIPALAERDYLPFTIDSLSQSEPAEVLNDTLVLVVVNNRAPGSGADDNVELRQQIEDNALTLKWLEEKSGDARFPLAWIDASSPGNEMPARGGVGLARKIGCDSVLALLSDLNMPVPLDEFVFFSLDADTIVCSDYLETAGCELRKSACAGGVISFRHQKADSPGAQSAIDEYEAFLDYYVAGLRWAGSPYAFHTVGSCICFTAAAYIHAGGFSARRQAGEDFYFCVELAKTGGIYEIEKTTVFPSARISRRVPFGTGKRMDESLRGGEALLAYDSQVFVCLNELLSAVSHRVREDAEGILAAIAEPSTREFLVARRFPDIWSRFQKQYKTDEAVLSAFHRWFDGFITLKYIHFLSEKKWPRRPLKEVHEAHFRRSPVR